MKIIQITDTHLMPVKANLYKLNPSKNLVACVNSINKFHNDSDLCIITGDLTNNGDRQTYLDLSKILKKLKIPYYPLIGNHDHREIFSEIFPEVPIDKYGFVQQSITIPFGKIILLDTVENKKNWGSFCEKRAIWLQDQLEKANGSHVYLFMHHPPFNIGIPALDRISINKDSQRIEKILKKFSNIKHIFFGHVHRNVSGSWNEIPFSAVRGTNHQIQLDQNEKLYLNYCHEPPSYSVILIERRHTTVHYFEYLENSFYKKAQ